MNVGTIFGGYFGSFKKTELLNESGRTVTLGAVMVERGSAGQPVEVGKFGPGVDHRDISTLSFARPKEVGSR